MTSLVLACLVLAAGCATGTSEPGVPGPYKTWDEVIVRWIGKHAEDRQIELGPPTFHPRAEQDGYGELLWDVAIPGLPGQAAAYGTFALLGAGSGQLLHLVNPEGIIEAGRRLGCE